MKHIIGTNITENLQFAVGCRGIRLVRGGLKLPLPFRCEEIGSKVDRKIFNPIDIKSFKACVRVLLATYLDPNGKLHSREDIEFEAFYIYRRYYIGHFLISEERNFIKQFIEDELYRFRSMHGFYNYRKWVKEIYPHLVVKNDTFTCNINVAETLPEDSLTRRRIAMGAKFDARKSIFFKVMFSLTKKQCDHFFHISPQNYRSKDKSMKVRNVDELLDMFCKERRRCGIAHADIKKRCFWDYFTGLMVDFGFKNVDELYEAINNPDSFSTIYSFNDEYFRKEFVKTMCQGVLQSYPIKKSQAIFRFLNDKFEWMSDVVYEFVKLLNFSKNKCSNTFIEAPPLEDFVCLDSGDLSFYYPGFN